MIHSPDRTETLQNKQNKARHNYEATSRDMGNGLVFFAVLGCSMKPISI